YQPADGVMPKITGARFYSPLVLNIAANEGISLAELAHIPGSGKEGRVSDKVILQWSASRRMQPANTERATPTAEPTIAKTVESIPTPAIQVSAPAEEPKATEYTGNVEIVEMDRMRKMIAKHMIESKHTSAHVTSFTECDVTSIVQWREKI